MKNHHYLATTGISRIWDLNANLLLLGPWCLASESNRKLLEGKEYTLLPSPWKPATKIKAAADYCHELYEDLMPTISEKLNTLHGVDYPERYWRVLVGYWLLIFIHQIYDRYMLVRCAAACFPEFHTTVLPREQFDLVSLNMFDFSDNARNDYYNLKLFSIICISLFPDKVNITPYQETIERQPIRYSRLHKFANRVIRLMSSGNIVLSELYHISYKEIIVLAIKSHFRTFTFMNFEPELVNRSHRNYSPEVRKGLEFSCSSDPFLSLLYSLIPKALPISYVEDYHAYKLSIQEKGENNPRIVGSVVGWNFNEPFKYFAAEAVAKGARLVGFQHGGGYGMSLSVPQEKICMEKDVFFSWGWEKNGADNITPLPSPYLSNLKDAHLLKDNIALFVGTAMPHYTYRFANELFPEDMQEYFNDKNFFLLSLSTEIRENIIYRPFPNKYGWGDKEFVTGLFSNIRFIEKGKLTNWMRRAKLAIFDHPATSFIEALTINVPTVLYWDHDIFLMRAEAEEYFELLRAAGILHRDPEGAAKKVNDIYDDSVSWWQQPEIQEARNAFCSRFALTSDDWIADWKAALTSIH